MRVGQSKAHSALESIVNIVVGYALGYAGSYFAIRLMNYPISHAENFMLTNFMTVISFVRSYYLRRLFNAAHLRGWL